jgi:hypothetical protein
VAVLVVEQAALVLLVVQVVVLRDNTALEHQMVMQHLQQVKALLVVIQLLLTVKAQTVEAVEVLEP